MEEHDFDLTRGLVTGVLLLTVPVAVVDPLVAARALVRGDLAADGTRARVVRDLLYTAHYY